MVRVGVWMNTIFLYCSITRFFSLSGTGKPFQIGDKKNTFSVTHIFAAKPCAVQIHIMTYDVKMGRQSVKVDMAKGKGESLTQLKL